MHWQEFNEKYDKLQKTYPGSLVLIRNGDVFVGRGAKVSLAYELVPLLLYGGRDGVITTSIPIQELAHYVDKLVNAGIPVFLDSGDA